MQRNFSGKMPDCIQLMVVLDDVYLLPGFHVANIIGIVVVDGIKRILFFPLPGYSISFIGRWKGTGRMDLFSFLLGIQCKSKIEPFLEFASKGMIYDREFRDFRGFNHYERDHRLYLLFVQYSMSSI